MNLKYEISSWEIFKGKIKQLFKVDFIKVDDLLVNEPVIYRWEEFIITEIYNKLSELKGFEGDLFIVTDVSYNEGMGPFVVNSNDLEDFIKNHDDLFGEPFLDTDIIIISFEHKVAWVIHHEGIYTVVSF